MTRPFDRNMTLIDLQLGVEDLLTNRAEALAQMSSGAPWRPRRAVRLHPLRLRTGGVRWFDPPRGLLRFASEANGTCQKGERAGCCWKGV